MDLSFFSLSLAGFVLTLAATGIVKKIALKKQIVDDPAKAERKIHARPIPLLGGIGIYLGFVVTVFLALYYGLLPGSSASTKHLFGIIFGGGWLVIGGMFDDMYDFSPKNQIIWPILAVLTVIISGIGIESISNPTGGQWFLNQFDIVLFWLNDLPYKFTFLADIFTFFWLMAMIYALKFFDGLDGLVSGITVIGSLVIYFTSILPHVAQPDTGLLALIVASCFAAFLAFNFNPAKMFLGESGSTLAGFFIGSLAIISEGKVVTTLVIMSLPILDLIWVIIRRIIIDKTSPVKADKKHIHHRLLETGLSHRSVVLLLYLWVAIVGLIAFLVQGIAQWGLLIAIVLAFIAFASYLARRVKKSL